MVARVLGAVMMFLLMADLLNLLLDEGHHCLSNLFTGVQTERHDEVCT
jgi:hypothetical protein